MTANTYTAPFPNDPQALEREQVMSFRKVADLAPGDRMVMPYRKDGREIVRTFDHMTGPHYKGTYGHDVYHVHYREGKTPEWSGANAYVLDDSVQVVTS